MRLFKTRTAKLKERIVSLEAHLGLAYAEKDDYYEHLDDTYGTIPNMKQNIKNLQAKDKAKK